MQDSEEVAKLVSLKEVIFNDVLPLIDSGSLEAGERYDLYSRLAQSRGKSELYEKAYQAAKEIGDADEKLRAYLDLLGEVDFEIQTKSDEPEVAPEPMTEQSSNSD